jgi:4-hydroxy-3-methylbut-2-en-1-yl diphosphate reductase
MIFESRTPMNILRAEHLGMCFGVRDAIALARRHAANGPVTILGQLVHNPQVVESLQRDGVRFSDDPVAASTPTLLITAHGASQQRLAAARATGREVVETTCPLVHAAHQALNRLVREGFHPVVIGQRGHVEVRGMTEDFAECDVILTEGDIAAMQRRAKLGVVSQTTQPVERVRHLVACLRQRFPDSEIRFRDTVCQPTKLRQNAAEDLARRCDVVVVIGGANSNNTRELVATCQRFCSRVHHVHTDADLRPEWFRSDDTVGVTAGTSTPDAAIEAVHEALLKINHVSSEKVHA